MLDVVALAVWKLCVEVLQLEHEAPPKLWKSHWTQAIFSRRRKIGMQWSDPCDGVKTPRACVFAAWEMKLMQVWWEEFLSFHPSGNAISSSCPIGRAATGSVPCVRNTWRPPSKLRKTPSHQKIDVTSKSPVGDVSVVTPIRTDATLDHSQQAEKGMRWNCLHPEVWTGWFVQGFWCEWHVVLCSIVARYYRLLSPVRKLVALQKLSICVHGLQ